MGLAEREGPLDPERVVAIGATVCSALSYAHENDVVHRDMKPDNVLIAADGTLKVGDFGIAKAAFVGREITTTGSLLGTVTYISPEQAQGAEPDHRSDIYSLGAMLYELLTGRPPFKGETALATAMMHLKEQPPPLRSLRAGIPRPVESAVLKALAKEPKNRYSSAEDFRRELVRGSATGGSTSVMRTAAPAAAPTHAPSHGDGRWIGRVIALVVALVLVAVGIAWLLGTGEEGGGAPGNGNGEVGAPISVGPVQDFDPPPGGDGTEHRDQISLATDGDTTTAWTTENYSTPLQAQKEGVGLLFDLQDEVEVGQIEIRGSPGMTFEVRSGTETGTTQDDFTTVVSGQQAADGITSVELGPDAGRYWLIWITEFAAGSGEGAIYEVRFLEP
jgi:hypothetical protein